METMIKKVMCQKYLHIGKNRKNNMMSFGRQHYAVFAGLSGSAASIFGKLISQTESILNNSSSLSNQQVNIQ